MEFVQQFAGTGPPGHGRPDLADDVGREGVDDFPALQLHAGLLQDAGGEDQGLADELHGLLVRPLSAVGVDEGVFGFDPVRLGVDDGAIHVPERGFEQGLGG